MQNSTRRIIRNFINKHGRSKLSTLIELLRQQDHNSAVSDLSSSNIAERLEISVETVELMSVTLHNRQKSSRNQAKVQ